MTKNPLPGLTIIILTYNSETTLRVCLTAIINLAYPKDRIEVIILDNGSSDDTIDIIHEFGFKYYLLPELNLSELRNFGAGKASSDIIAYVDSDCVVSQNWAFHVVKWFTDPLVGIVGNEYLLPASATYFEKNWYSQCNYGIKGNDLIPAGNMAINKKIFSLLGGFSDMLLTGEDDYILEKFRSAGYKTISDHKIHSVHLGNAKNIKEYFKKETWYGKGMLGTLRFNLFDKPLIATVSFFLFFVLSSFSGLFFVVTKNETILSWVFFPAVSVFIAIPFCSALERIFLKRRRGNILYVTVIFIVFFLARINALVSFDGIKRFDEKN